MRFMTWVLRVREYIVCNGDSGYGPLIKYLTVYNVFVAEDIEVVDSGHSSCSDWVWVW